MFNPGDFNQNNNNLLESLERLIETNPLRDDQKNRIRELFSSVVKDRSEHNVMCLIKYVSVLRKSLGEKIVILATSCDEGYDRATPMSGQERISSEEALLRKGVLRSFGGVPITPVQSPDPSPSPSPTSNLFRSPPMDSGDLADDERPSTSHSGVRLEAFGAESSSPRSK
jgi:hypothetical protein